MTLCTTPMRASTELTIKTRRMSHFVGRGLIFALSNAISMTGTSSNNARRMIMTGVQDCRGEDHHHQHDEQHDADGHRHAIIGVAHHPFECLTRLLDPSDDD